MSTLPVDTSPLDWRSSPGDNVETLAVATVRVMGPLNLVALALAGYRGQGKGLNAWLCAVPYKDGAEKREAQREAHVTVVGCMESVLCLV